MELLLLELPWLPLELLVLPLELVELLVPPLELLWLPLELLVLLVLPLEPLALPLESPVLPLELPLLPSALPLELPGPLLPPLPLEAPPLPAMLPLEAPGLPPLPPEPRDDVMSGAVPQATRSEKIPVAQARGEQRITLRFSLERFAAELGEPPTFFVLRTSGASGPAPTAIREPCLTTRRSRTSAPCCLGCHQAGRAGRCQVV